MRRRRLRRRSTAERGDARAVVGGAIGRRVALDASVRRHLSNSEQFIDASVKGLLFVRQKKCKTLICPPPAPLEQNIYPPRLMRFTQLSGRVRRRHGHSVACK